MAENGVSGKLTDIKINIECDVSETLTGLKAVQREAKEAARALKELESVNQKYTLTPREGIGTVGFVQYEPPTIQRCIESFGDEELWEELSRRKGVKFVSIPNSSYAELMVISHKTYSTQKDTMDGPLEIMVRKTK